MLHWTDKLATGDSEIDHQHRQLIFYVNRLEELAHTTNPQREEVEQFWSFVDFMEAYLIQHFQHEEACMYRVRCAAYAQNKKAHSDFLDFFRNYRPRLGAEGCGPAIIKELYDSCSAWVQNHILRIDMRLRSPSDPPPPSRAPGA